jgi:predicted DNA binding CopG/RHH family protein
MKKQLIVPKFNDEDEEREFWDTIDITEYADPSDFKRFMLAKLVKAHKTKPVTLRLPESVIEEAKEEARHLDIPYQRLIRQYITDGLKKRHEN